MMFSIDLSKPYPPVGRQCIYCGTPYDLCPLGDEHIVPASLGSNGYLAEASCGDCENTTKYIEGYCARQIFQPIRIQHKIPRKRRRKEKLVPLPISDGFGSPPIYLLSPKDHPDILFLPIFSPPGLVLGGPQAKSQFNFAPGVWPLTDDAESRARVERLRTAGIANVWIHRELKITAFAQMLAKIGHVAATARFGLNGFRPLLLRAIKTGDNIPYLVGGASIAGGKTGNVGLPAPFLHSVQLETRRINGKEYVVAWICLFAYIGAPVYNAIVGEL